MANQKVQFEIAAVDNASKEIKKVEQNIAGLGNTFKSTFSAIASYDIGKNIAMSLFDIGKSAINLAGDLEQTRIAFTTMTGDARIADAFIREMTNFAKTTPFEIGQLETASKQLLAYGIEVQNVLPDLKMLGDISAGVGMDKLPQLITAFGQVSAATKLTGNELRQFTEAGVPLLDELANVMGKPVTAIQDLVSNGEVGFPIVQKALENLTKEGGRFNNLMEKQSKSFGGMVSNFQDTITIMLRDMGSEFLPGMKKILGDMLTFWDKNGKAMSASFIGFVKEIFTVFSEAWGGIATIFDTVSSFFIDTNKQTTEGLAFSWKNLFLYLDLGIKSIALAFKIVGAYIAYQMVNASYSAQIAFANLKNGFSIMGLGIMATAGFIGQNIAAGITWGIGKAIKALDWLIDALNNIPGLDIKKIGDTFKEVETINFKQASVMAGEIMGVHSDLLDGVTALENEKAAMLKGIASETKDMIMTDVNKMSDSYLNFTNAQNNAGASGRTLAEVLKEIGKAGKNLGSIGAGGDSKKGGGKSEAEKTLEDLKKLGKETADSLEGIFGGLVGKIDSQKGKLLGLKDDYQKLKEKLKEVGDTGVAELQKIQDKLDEQSGKIKNIAGEGQIDIAKRLIEAQKELQTIKDKQALGEGITTEELEKRFALEKEIALGESKTTGEERAKAIEESQKSETQLILDKTAKKLADAEIERVEIQKTYDLKKIAIEKETLEVKTMMDAKKAQITDEFNLYQDLILKRKVIEAEYFTLFQKNIGLQINKTREAIALIGELNLKTGGKTVGLDGARAEGGPVSSGQTYLVGERGPELFVPSGNGSIVPNNQLGGAGNQVTINMGGVTVNSKADADYFSDQVIEKITRKLQLYKLGIS